MRKAICAVATLMALCGPTAATDLSGRWNVLIPSSPGYEGVVLIDTSRRVTFDTPKDNGRPAYYLGYISASSIATVAMVLTNHTIVVRINCIVDSDDLLHCATTFNDGKKSVPYMLERAGPPPGPLTIHR